jgi:hypothetical protein
MQRNPTELREKLAATGLDAGPETIRWQLKHHHAIEYVIRLADAYRRDLE